MFHEYIERSNFSGALRTIDVEAKDISCLAGLPDHIVSEMVIIDYGRFVCCCEKFVKEKKVF